MDHETWLLTGTTTLVKSPENLSNKKMLEKMLKRVFWSSTYAAWSTAPIVNTPFETGSSMWFNSIPQTAEVKLILFDLRCFL